MTILFLANLFWREGVLEGSNLSKHVEFFLEFLNILKDSFRLMVRTVFFQDTNMGSIPIKNSYVSYFLFKLCNFIMYLLKR
jgi:hypothetical protein